MTPEREAYLAKCGRLERQYRLWIKLSKERIKEAKANISQRGDIYWEKDVLRAHKLYLSWYRHELNRLKRMDRVATPYEVMRFGFEANVPRVSYNCECFEPIDRKYKFCPNCGRKFLWEKVKQ